MSTEIVMSVYRPHPGEDRAIAALIARHVPLLRAEGLATDREPIVMRSQDGTYLEVFEWDPAVSEIPPHQIPAVKRIWDEMAAVADFATIASLPEASEPFASFTPA